MMPERETEFNSVLCIAKKTDKKVVGTVKKIWKMTVITADTRFYKATPKVQEKSVKKVLDTQLKGQIRHAH